MSDHDYLENPDQSENPLPEFQNLEGSLLLQILNDAGARRVLRMPAEDLGIADDLPYPFIGIVGQLEMRFALMLSLINPSVGGVLLIGPRGVGKTTAVRSLTSILPEVPIPVDKDGVPTSESGEEEAGIRYERVKLVELPLNARLEDVVGGINERIAIQQQKVRLERGILARADQNLLYVDEVNLLDDQIVDAILDASAQGHYTVRRGAMAGTYRSRFVLIGSMNPEEGDLRPQIMDRFGLRVTVRGLERKEDRLEIYKRVRAYRENPRVFLHEWATLTAQIREEVGLARELLKETIVSEKALELGISLVHELGIDSTRAEFTMFEAARAHAAADGRDVADVRDLRFVAPLALRQRRSVYMDEFFDHQLQEDQQIVGTFDQLHNGK
jgi:magnesium chelatase subunit I